MKLGNFAIVVFGMAVLTINLADIPIPALDQSQLRYDKHVDIYAHGPIGQEFQQTMNTLAFVEVYLEFSQTKVLALNIRNGTIYGNILAESIILTSYFWIPYTPRCILLISPAVTSFSGWVAFDFPIFQ